MPAARLPRWVNRYPPRGFAPRSAGRYTKPRGSPLLTTGTTSAVPLRGVNFARRSGVNIESRLTAEAELARLPVKAREGKALRSLLKHREGLSVFAGKPQVPMDNNAAERGLRGAVIGRRLSFGSDSEKGADFTAIMYSVVSTLSMHGIDVLRWLEAWLTACAENGRKPPDDLSPWLPWSMSEERKREFMAPG